MGGRTPPPSPLRDDFLEAAERRGGRSVSAALTALNVPHRLEDPRLGNTHKPSRQTTGPRSPCAARDLGAAPRAWSGTLRQSAPGRTRAPGRTLGAAGMRPRGHRTPAPQKSWKAGHHHREGKKRMRVGSASYYHFRKLMSAQPLRAARRDGKAVFLGQTRSRAARPAPPQGTPGDR